jgi:exopolysaccharide biosynthesis polyprenyl glycosylphosphotransferase
VSSAEGAAVARDAADLAELLGHVDERTRAILERRRRAHVVKRRGWLVRRALLVADATGLVFAYGVSQLPFDHPTPPIDRLSSTAEFVIFLLTLPLWVVVAKLYGLYDKDEERADHSTTDDLVGVFHVVTVGAWVLFVGSHLLGLPAPQLAKLAVYWLLAIGFVTSARAGARAYCRRQVHYLQNTVIVGAGDVGQLIARKFLRHPGYGINLVGFVDVAPKERANDLAHISILGPPDDLPAIVDVLDVERVVVAFSSERHEDTLRLIRTLSDFDLQIDIVPRLFEIVGPAISIHTVEGLPLVGLAPARLTRSSRLLKRFMDLVLATLALVVLAPVFAVIAIAIKLDSPGVVFFRQWRVGTGDRPFRIFKFRTMVADAEALKPEVQHLNKHLREGRDPRMFKVPDDPRVTRFGRVLRRTSLDELPQIVNVLRGEMSFVGPRPLILSEDSHVDDWARRRLDLKPGITGPWQVLGRDDIPFEEMIKLDYLYVTGWSLFTDLKLLLRTAPALVRRPEAP